MSENISASVIAGLLCSGLFLLVFGMGLGSLFMFLPTLPLFSLGLSHHPRFTLIGIGIATIIIAIVASPAAALLFLIFSAIPVWYICRESLLIRPTLDGVYWMPIGLIFVNVTLYACAIVIAIVLFYYGQPESMPALLSKAIHEQFADLQDQYGDVIDNLADQWSFLVFSITLWMWAFALYGHAWLAHRALAIKKLALRPDLSIRAFHLPSWMLTLLAISALASLIGSESVSFLGKSLLVSLMLPYFFCGMALLHAVSKKWPSRRFILFFVYFAIITQFWPALTIAIMALIHQLKLLNKHLSSGGTSTKK